MVWSKIGAFQKTHDTRSRYRLTSIKRRNASTRRIETARAFYDSDRRGWVCLLGHPSKIHFSCSKDNLNVAPTAFSFNGMLPSDVDGYAIYNDAGWCWRFKTRYRRRTLQNPDMTYLRRQFFFRENDAQEGFVFEYPYLGWKVEFCTNNGIWKHEM